jgi:hypothetical protein
VKPRRTRVERFPEGREPQRDGKGLGPTKNETQKWG